jgi:hypothetical protein
LNPVGLWTLHFDWGPKGNYDWTPLYFNFDGTFAYLAGANEGEWVQVDDKIVMRFKRQPNADSSTVYSGSATRNFMSGMMMSAKGGKGHWFAIKKGARVFPLKDGTKLPYLEDKQAKSKIDAAGNEV